MYDRLAQYYEWEHLHFEADFPLYFAFAKATEGAILDAACGTGRIAIPLAEAGRLVTGIDLSPEMLSIARSKVANSPAADRVRFVQSDIRTMALGEQFGMAVVALGSFHHLLTTADQKLALFRLAEHLVTGGLLVIDLVNPSPEWISAGDGALVHQLTAPFPYPDGEKQLSKFVSRYSDFSNQMDRSLLVYDLICDDGALRRLTVEMELRFLFRFEAELLLEHAGFRLKNIFGDYSLEEYLSSSPRMILVAEKR